MKKESSPQKREISLEEPFYLQKLLKRDIGKIRHMPKEEELYKVSRYKKLRAKYGDNKHLKPLRDEIVIANLPKMVYVIRKHYDEIPGVSKMDMYQVGIISLIKSLNDRFDPSLGHSFITYATKVIRSDVNKYLSVMEQNPSLSVRDYFQIKKIRDYSMAYYREHGFLPNALEIYEELQIPVARQKELEFLGLTPLSLDQTQSDGDSLGEHIPSDTIVEPNQSLDPVALRELLLAHPNKYYKKNPENFERDITWAFIASGFLLPELSEKQNDIIYNYSFTKRDYSSYALVLDVLVAEAKVVIYEGSSSKIEAIILKSGEKVTYEQIRLAVSRAHNVMRQNKGKIVLSANVFMDAG